ncbi:asparagine--tRNA ligase, cytoplasmic [Bombus fervidus]|uniref:asparagine--tRNA ligase, cytoplasmic n=1 Tax=Bombus fervidus TaxID=203811 RepID=UPI003D18DCD6
MFITLRDGIDFLHCVLTNILCQTYDALTLSTEASIEVFGTLKIVPDGKNAPNGHELHVDYWRLIGTSPGGAASILNEEVLPDVQSDNRHIMVSLVKTSRVLLVRSVLMQAFRDRFNENGYNDISANSGRRWFNIIQARLFWRRRIFDSKSAALFGNLPSSNGRLMLYGTVPLRRKISDPETPCRLNMQNSVNVEPIMFCRFPVEIKSFYTQRYADDKRLTESVDVLLPNVGEIVGASMRISDYDELLEGYSHANIDTKPYYWYTDQRKYGTCSHSGFGLGLERFLCWLLNRYHVREACLYSRVLERCRTLDFTGMIIHICIYISRRTNSQLLVGKLLRAFKNSINYRKMKSLVSQK